MLPQIFSSEQRLISGAGEVASKWKGRRPRCVLGRDLCIFFFIDLKHIAKSDRGKALKHQVAVKAPFKSPAYYALWHDGCASVWLWDDARADLLEYQQKGWDIVPEAALVEPKSSGQIKVHCLYGFDIQTWDNGLLIQSRWLSGDTNEKAGTPWQNDAVIPDETLDIDYARMAYGKGDGELGVHLERNLYIITFALLFSWIGYNGALWLSHSLENEKLSAEIDSVKEGVRPLLKLRDQAYAAKKQNSDLIALLNKPHAPLMASVIKALPSEQVELETWSYQKQRLEIVVKDSHADSREYVRIYEALDGLKGVQAKPYRDGLRLSAIVEQNAGEER